MLDRSRKAAVYARAGILEYWIVNIVDRLLEVYRDPGPLGKSGRFGYRTLIQLGEADTVSPLAAPSVSIPVSELLL